MIAAPARDLPLPRARPAHDRWLIAQHVVRSTRRGALIWGVVFGLFVLSTAAAYIAGYPTQTERQLLASSLGSFTILLGPAERADTVAGFTSWRVLTVISIMGAVWGLLTSTGQLRGEEDAGRWEMLLAGPTTRRGATTQVLVGLGGALGLLFLACLVLTLLAGRLPGARFGVPNSVLFALGLSSGAGMFLAIGAVTSQLSETRGQAARLAAIVLGGSYLVRMVADSRSSLEWLHWLSPLGWLQELNALRSPNLLALVPVIALIGACAALTVLLAERRDLGASLLQEGAVRRHETAWHGGALGLAARMTRSGAIGWIVGTGVMAFTMGSVAKSASSILSASPAIGAALGRLGVRQATEGYLGVAFLLFAVMLSLLAAFQVAAFRDEEASGRLDNLLVRPLSRSAWLAGRLAVSSAVILTVGLSMGVFAWLGASNQRLGVSLPTLLAAGLNATAPAFVVLGVGAWAFALRGSLAAPIAYGLVAWSFLVNLLGSFLKGWDWVRDTSVYSHMALAPSQAVDWGDLGFLMLLGGVAAALGIVGFNGRDVEYG